MNELERLGLLTSIVEMLNKAGSWTGRTHIQKFIYFAQEVLGLPSGYEFILYQRGPFSFDLDEDIRSLRSVGTVDIAPAPPYGPRYQPTEFGKSLIEKGRLSPEMTRHLTKLATILSQRKTARDLELLATTLYAIREGYKSQEDIVSRVLFLKPQFTRHQMDQAFSEVSQIQDRFAKQPGR